MKILVTPTSFNAQTRSSARDKLDRFADQVIFNPFGRPLEAAEIIPLLARVNGYIAGLDHINRHVLENAPACLKVILRYGTGYDRIDLKAATQRGIAGYRHAGIECRGCCRFDHGADAGNLKPHWMNYGANRM